MVVLLCWAAGAAAAPAGPAPAAPAKPETRRDVFEYIEELRISGPETDLRVRSNVLVAVTTEGERVTVEVRPDPGRKRTKADDPAPGMASSRPGSGEPAEAPLGPLKAVFVFAPGPAGSMRVEGLSGRAAGEACGILSQGPASNPLKSGAVLGYRIRLLSGGKPFELRGEQRNGRLWVDWTLTGSGTFEVGEKGWELPVSFVLPEQETNDGAMTLSAEAAMLYSSVRPGPEKETTFKTALTFSGKEGEFAYARTCELRPIVVPVSEESPPSSGALPKGSLGGRAGVWARASTLATLGVQRLSGVRETGLAMWAAQVSVDSVPRPGGESVKELDRRGPTLRPPPELLGEGLGGGRLLRLAMRESVLSLAATADGRSDTSLASVPDMAVSVGWRYRGRWRLGAGLDGIWTGLGTKYAEEFWMCWGLTGRVEYAAEKWNVAFWGGPAWVRYAMDSPKRWAEGSLLTFGVGADGEWMAASKLGLGLGVNYAGDGTLVVLRVEPSLRWYLRRNMAVRAQCVWLSMSDADAEGGGVATEGFGGGVGISVRW